MRLIALTNDVGTVVYVNPERVEWVVPAGTEGSDGCYVRTAGLALHVMESAEHVVGSLEGDE